MARQIRLRPYQLDVDVAQKQFMDDSSRSRALVVACTGSGKTVNFTKLIIEHALDRKRNGKQTWVLIAHPRLALSEDQQVRFAKLLAEQELTYASTSFHTGEVYDPNTLIANPDALRAISTTKKGDLKKIRKSSRDDVHITWSTYHSLERIAGLNYDLIICDEAHYLTQDRFKRNLDKFRPDVKTIFYTATPIHRIDDHEHSMLNNSEKFGKDPIVVVNPRDLIPQGYVVPPKVKFMSVIMDRSGSPDFAPMIGRAFKMQTSKSDPRYNHKMLVVMDTISVFDDLMNEAVRTKIAEEASKDSIDLYYVTASDVCLNGDLRKFSGRRELLKHFSENLNPSIIIHYDTLAEGIDIDGIGGVLFFRELGISKTLQTMGRACRPAVEDLSDDGLSVRKDRIKTCSQMTLVAINGQDISSVDAPKWIQAFKVGGYENFWNYCEQLYANGERNGDKIDIITPEDKAQIKYIKFDNLSAEFVQQLELELDHEAEKFNELRR